MIRHDASPSTPTGRVALKKRNGAARARNWRAEKKAKGEPLPRDTDQAVCEAVSFILARNKQAGRNRGGQVAPIDVTDLFVMSKIILEREGFNPDAAGRAVADRLGVRDPHTWPDHIPSLRPGSLQRMRETKAGPWTTPVDQIVRFMGGAASK